MNQRDNPENTHFGFESVPLKAKAKKVAEVFHSVAPKYDLMNDLMSLGAHRLWKRFAVNSMGLRSGLKVLDLAGGTGDLSALISPTVGDKGLVILADINTSMMQVGRNRLLDQGLYQNIRLAQVNAEQLCFAPHTFDRIIIGFGLRNVTDKAAALQSMYESLKPGGRALILEFSKPTSSVLQKIYDQYSFKVLPKLGEWIAQDEQSYRYLAESIRMHPEQDSLRQMMETAGFENCDYLNLCGGIVAIHRGYKF
ncbi:MAG TPA: bifunctional demethylmenaquinone methyltransferase/2-methoxy-6-polyprenyl-1,4-benzoquinol methylase UbiE [Coxiellaceae bacterium]|nr:bifunctional demethylmenaquinone methyltransferase/2-methoxy-6-polyprenyl-1,4-benzoquinol methylase UbiE [Coxiellaceae bacterium]